MYNYSDIKEIHLEITQKCQAACPMCDRNENGGKDNKHITNAELSLNDIKNIFKPEFIKQLNTMYMCGNLGDPIIAKDTLAVFQYFREHNSTMWLSMNTNAGARDAEWWKSLATTIGKHGSVIFSVDGLEDTNHLYRQNVNWANVLQSMTSFISAGGRARWDFLIFEHNQHQVEIAENLSKTLGFEKFVAKKTGRFVTASVNPKESHVVKNKVGEQTIILHKPLPKYQNSALASQTLLINEYGSMDAYYDTAYIDCKVKKTNSLFITAEGLALPCCWTAGRMYKWWHEDPTIEQIWKFIDRAGGKDAINAKYGLESVFLTGIFQNISNSWQLDSCSNGKLKVCSMKCGSKFDPFSAQFTV